MRDAVICEPIRTPVGRYGGVLRDVPAHELGAHVIRELIARTGINPRAVDDVIFAQCYPSMDAPALGRVVALDAGLPVEVGGLQLDRRCGSGLQAVINATMQVATGASDPVIAGGAESMSRAALYTHEARWGLRSGGLELHDSLARGRVTAGGASHPVPGGMLETAENLRRQYGISRLEQDEFSLRSHQPAVAAQQARLFKEEIVPVTVRGRRSDTVVDTNEHPRPDTSPESLSQLRPVASHAGSGSRRHRHRRQLQRPKRWGVRLPGHDSRLRCSARAAPAGPTAIVAVAWVDPEIMGIGPVPLTAKALERAKLRLADMDLIELNEAFAAQVLAVLREWDLRPQDHERLNVNGSGISLGHPVGATGGRILATLLREMDRRDARYGLETMCIGGGQGLAAVFERP